MKNLEKSTSQDRDLFEDISRIIFPEPYLESVSSSINNQFYSCYFFALNWIRQNRDFTSEDLITAYNHSGNPIPKEVRVWGAVIKALKKAKFIRNNGFGVYKKPCGHAKPVNIWQTILKNWESLAYICLLFFAN